jgi:hypothetical protein
VRTAAGVAALALAAVPAPALAASGGVVVREPLRPGGTSLAVAPVLMGSRGIAWGEGSARRTMVRTRRRSFTAPAITRDGAVTSIAGLGGSASRLAVGRAVHAGEDPAIALTTLDSGPPTGPLKTLVPARFYFTGTECQSGLAGGVTSFAVSGRRLAWVEARCDGTDPAVTVQLQSRPGAAPRTVSSGSLGALGPLALAGQYLAYRTEQAVVVVNLGTGEPAYTVPIGAAVPSGGAIGGLAVQADGKVAIAAGSSIFWASPSDPTLRRLAFAVSGANVALGPPRLADDRVAVDARDRSGVRALIVATLDGHMLTRVRSTRTAPLAAGSSNGPAVDFDGTRLAYATQRPPQGHRRGRLRILVRVI